MNQTSPNNLSLEYEDKEEELLVYKLEEVKSDWVNDVVKIPKELLNEINDMITDPNAERVLVLEKAIRTLRRKLISKNLEIMNDKINKYKTSTVDFSDIAISMKHLERQLNKPLDINDLNMIYKNELQPLKYKLFNRAKVARNKKRNWILTIACTIIIATFFYFLGRYT